MKASVAFYYSPIEWLLLTEYGAYDFHDNVKIGNGK
jgi:hypothetical protein